MRTNKTEAFEVAGNRRRRLTTPPPGWSELPQEFLASIAARLTTHQHLSKFRAVCRKWRSSTPSPSPNPNLYPPNLPRRIPADAKLPFNERHKYDSLFLVSSSVFVVQTIDSPSIGWILTAERSGSGSLRVVCPFSRVYANNFSKAFPKTLDLSKFDVKQVAQGFNFRVLIEDQKKFKMGLNNSSIPRRSLICSAFKVIIYPIQGSNANPPNAMDDCTVMVLYEGGNLAALNSKSGKWWYLCYTGDGLFDDIVVFKGMVCAVDRSGRVHAINDKAKVIKSVVNTLIRGGGGGVVADDYMRKRLVESCGDLHLVVWIGVCASQGNVWFKVYKMNENRWCEVKHFGDRTLFVGLDCCFFVSTRELQGFQPNRVVSQRICFVRYGGDHIPEDSLFERAIKGEEKAHFLKDSDVLGLKPLHPGFSQSIWPLSTWNPDEEKKVKLVPCSKDARVEDLKQTVTANVCDPKRSKNSNGDIVAVQPSQTNRTTIHGKDVRTDLVPVLEKVWAKYGNIVEGSAIRSCDVINMACESVAKVVRILQSTSANNLTDHQVEYLVSTLFDLQLMQVKVDWLVPIVEKAVALHKSKPLVVAIMDLEKAKARVAELKLKLLAESEKPDSGLKLAAVESLSASGPVDLDKCLGEGLC